MHITTFLLGATLLLAGCAASPSPTELATDSIHAAAIVVDTHVDIPPNYATAEVDPSVLGDMQVDLPKMVSGGVDVAFFIVYVKQGERSESGYAEARQAAITKFDAIHRQSEIHGESIELAQTAASVERILAEGKLVAMIGVENSFPIGTDLGLIEDFYDRGARYMSLTHAGHNDLADSANPTGRTLETAEPEHGGLSDLGHRAVLEMNRLGIMVDVSHASEATTLQAAALSRAPIIASHSAVEALSPIARNLSDQELDAIKASGGVAQIVAFDWYLRPPQMEKVKAILAARDAFGIKSAADLQALSAADKAALRERIEATHKQWPRTTISDLVDHIDYAVNRIGVDHVGIASDFGGGGGIDGWDDASQTPDVTAELVRRGYSTEDISKIWGGNLLRILRDVERVATELAADTHAP